MRNIKALILVIYSVVTFSFDGICQIKVSGHVFDNENRPFPGCTVQEFRTVNAVTSMQNGEFSFIVKNDSSILQFYSPMYKKLWIRIDTIDKDNIKAILVPEIISTEVRNVIAGPVPLLEVGYMGLINNRPIGIHIETSSIRKFPKGYINVMTKNFDNSLISFELGPNRIFKSPISKYLNLYSKGSFDQSNSNIFFCSRISAIRRLTINFGLGTESKKGLGNNLIFLTGIRTGIPFIPVYHSMLEINTFYNKQTFDFSSTFYIEFYNKNYRNLSMSIGYQSLFGSRDIMANINYKHYFIDRKKGVLKSPTANTDNKINRFVTVFASIRPSRESSNW